MLPDSISEVARFRCPILFVIRIGDVEIGHVLLADIQTRACERSIFSGHGKRAEGVLIAFMPSMALSSLFWKARGFVILRTPSVPVISI